MSATLEGVRVLVVDDEPDSLLMMEMFFRRRRATVCTAASAHEGRRTFESFAPDVIVSDIAMPGEDGYQFLRSIRALPAEAGGNTPAIAVTAYAYPDDRRTALEAGFDEHLAKPANHQELLQAVHHLTEGARPRSDMARISHALGTSGCDSASGWSNMGRRMR